MTATRRLPWIAPGDINGFFGLVVDNLSILGFLATALIGIFGFPAEVVFARMFPGTALGVLVGNLIYTAMARKLARDSGRDNVTAMPLGLDAPTTIGLALLVLGPAFVGFKQQGLAGRMQPQAPWIDGIGLDVRRGVRVDAQRVGLDLRLGRERGDSQRTGDEQPGKQATGGVRVQGHRSATLQKTVASLVGWRAQVA